MATSSEPKSEPKSEPQSKDSSDSSDEESFDLNGEQKPSQEYDRHWIYVDTTTEQDSGGDILGKWLVFKHVSVIDKYWDIIRSAIISGQLGPCKLAKVATMKGSSLAFDPNIKVICVYTTAEDMDYVGVKLVRLARQTIRYKTDEATLAGRYRVLGSGKTTCRTLSWNNGNPKFTE